MFILFALLSFSIFIPISAIINGFPANKMDMLSQVSIQTIFTNKMTQSTEICGGVLIASNIVLTAGHCVKKSGDFSAKVRVTIGDYNRKEFDEEEVVFNTWAVVVPNDFEKTTDDNNDIAIIFLSHPVDICISPTSTQLARLPKTSYFDAKEKQLSNQQFESSLCYIAGWGMTENGEFPPTPKQMFVNLQVNNFRGKLFTIAKGALPNQRVCFGDSGSPVYCHVNGIRYFIGILTRIGHFRSQQNNQTDKLSVCQDFEFGVVADWRESSRGVVDILEEYTLLDQVTQGQQQCFN